MVLVMIWMKLKPILHAKEVEQENNKKEKFYGAINQDNKFNETMTEPYYNVSNNITNTSSSLYPMRGVAGKCNESNCLDDEIFSEDWERTVSISVFILFGLIFIAGLIGNGLVVLGKRCNWFLSFYKEENLEISCLPFTLIITFPSHKK